MRDRILHLADLHLGDPHDYLGERASERRREADGLLGRIVDRVLTSKSKVGGVIIAGDLFEHYAPSPSLVEKVLGSLGKLVGGGVELLTVPGNHDEYSYPTCVYRSFRDRWPGTLVTCPAPERVATWNLGDSAIDLYAMAYVAGASKPPFDQFEVEKNDRFKVAVLHGTLDIQSGDRSIPISSQSLERRGLDYVALGHLHSASERALGKKGQAVYPGRIEGAGFRDPGGAPLLEVEFTKQGPILHREPIASRAIETHELPLSAFATPQELDTRIERISEGREDSIVRLALRGVPGFTLDPDALRARWSDRFYHLEVSLPGEDDGQMPQLDVLRDEPTVRGRFVRIALERIEQLDNERERRVAEMALREGLAAFGSGRSERSR
ncbi:MAG: DNA repair exonuclease [Candidatus Eisenbacteria bacterium]